MSNSSSYSAQSPLRTIEEVQHYLDVLFTDAPPDAWLVVSWIDATGAFRSQWFRIAQIDDAARFIVRSD